MRASNSRQKHRRRTTAEWPRGSKFVDGVRHTSITSSSFSLSLSFSFSLSFFSFWPSLEGPALPGVSGCCGEASSPAPGLATDTLLFRGGMASSSLEGGMFYQTAVDSRYRHARPLLSNEYGGGIHGGGQLNLCIPCPQQIGLFYTQTQWTARCTSTSH